MIEDVTTHLISKALNLVMMRETAIASNIANIKTQGYQPLDIRFEQLIREENTEPTYYLSEKQTSLDEQIALNIQNMTHYHALIKGLNEKLALMRIACGSSS